jgi:hypothetical protein
MNHLPIESPEWREEFKQQIALERTVLQTLIQWGLTESACDIHRAVEGRFGDTLGYRTDSGKSQGLAPAEGEWLGHFLRDTYLKTRDIPRTPECQDRLHDALLTGFRELATQLIQCYENGRKAATGPAASQRAA